MGLGPSLSPGSSRR